MIKINTIAVHACAKEYYNIIMSYIIILQQNVAINAFVGA